MQNINRMRARVNQVAVNTHERDETDLTEVSVSLVESQNGHVLHLADGELLQISEQHRGRIRRSYRRRHQLKSVLPALVREMSYGGLEVADGQAAGIAWDSLVRGGLDRDNHDRVRNALLDYCGQETLGMVRLLEKLQRVSA